MSSRRVMAIVRKEIRDYRRNRYMVVTMAIIPLIFLFQPLISILNLPAAASVPLSHKHELLYMLGIPALVPSVVAASSVVTERMQGTLEPILTTPIRRKEFLLAKALAPLLPSVAISYLVYGIFVVIIELFAHSGVAPALLQGSVVLAQVIFTPLIALWSIWVGIAVSTRSSDIRPAQQLSVLGNLPVVALTTLVAFNVIHATLALAVGLGAALLVVDRFGWRIVSAMFDRERLITGMR
ncbi:MAG: ABC transporter permease subunit [Solirubrobacterales bacterium]|nr:ABC transporter permease subunit [Solirubrobacterales bacterium]